MMPEAMPWRWALPSSALVLGDIKIRCNYRHNHRLGSKKRTDFGRAETARLHRQ